MCDNQLFLNELESVVEERKKVTENFNDAERIFWIKGYYDKVLIEMKMIADRIFSDKEFFEEQFSHYSNFRDYINDIINDMAKEDLEAIF